MIWLEIILLVIKFGPTIIQLVLAIIELIKKQPAGLQAGYYDELLQTCRRMRKTNNKIQGQSDLEAMKTRLEASV